MEFIGPGFLPSGLSKKEFRTTGKEVVSHPHVGAAERARMRDFRRLLVWRRAHALVLNVRRATRSLPRRGYGSLKSQAISAAESIACNIVEGCGAASQREFARFLDISIKSSCELEYQLQLATDCRVITQRDWRLLSAEAVEIRRMLCGLRRVVLEAARVERSRTGG